MTSSPHAGTANPPSPERIFETLTAYQRTAALKGAIDLDVFTAIAEGAHSVTAIAARCQASERGTRILCDYLTVNGFLLKENSGYQLTEESAMFLNRNSPAYLGSATRFLNSAHSMNGFVDLAETVRRGTTTLGGEGSMDPEHPMWVDFARAMMPMMFPAAEGIARILEADKGEKMKVLDLAAGHGIFGITIARHNPNAEIYAVDWPSVLAVATENAQKLGVAARHHLIPGSAFEVDFGSDYDVVLFTNFFHHFDEPTCELLMRKAHISLKPGGRAITLEFIPNEDRVTPPLSAAFSLTMLASTKAGDAYTLPQYDRMFRNAGYVKSELHQIAGSPNQMIVTWK